MKRFLPILACLALILPAKDAFSLNIPQTVTRMERRGWTLEELQRIPHWGEEHIAAIYRWKKQQPAWRPRLLMIYRRDAIDGLQIIETGKEYFLTLARDIAHDIDRDGRPEVAVEFFAGGTDWEGTWLEVYTLDVGKVKRFIYPKQENLVLRKIQDVDGDGIPELVFLDTQWEFYGSFDHASSPAVWRYMRWDPIEGRYREDPQRLWMAYGEDIQTILSRLGEQTFFYSYVGDAMSILLNYHLLGEPQRGWAEFEHLLSRIPASNPDDPYSDETYQKEFLKEIRADLPKRLEQSW